MIIKWTETLLDPEMKVESRCFWILIHSYCTVHCKKYIKNHKPNILIISSPIYCAVTLVYFILTPLFLIYDCLLLTATHYIYPFRGGLSWNPCCYAEQGCFHFDSGILMWHVEQQATVIFSAMLCKNLYSTWTHYWGAFVVAAKLKLESFSWTTVLIDDGIFFFTNHISANIKMHQIHLLWAVWTKYCLSSCWLRWQHWWSLILVISLL